jgi:hypothetical protein
MRYVPCLQPPHQFEFDVVRAKPVEQASPPAEQDRHEMDLHLAEQPRPQQRLRRAGTVHHHVATARCGPGPLGAVFDVGDELRAARRDICVVEIMGEDEDRHAVVVITLPAPGQLEGAPAGDHRACRHGLAEHLSARAIRHPVVHPVEQPTAVAAQLLARTVVRSGDEAVQGHGHVQHELAHRVCSVRCERRDE